MAELVQSIDMEMFYRDKVEWHTKYGDDMGMFDAGDNVVLHGLVGRPDLNVTPWSAAMMYIMFRVGEHDAMNAGMEIERVSDFDGEDCFLGFTMV